MNCDRCKRYLEVKNERVTIYSYFHGPECECIFCKKLDNCGFKERFSELKFCSELCALLLIDSLNRLFGKNDD
jgi:hypothetical protein